MKKSLIKPICTTIFITLLLFFGDIAPIFAEQAVQNNNMKYRSISLNEFNYGQNGINLFYDEVKTELIGSELFERSARSINSAPVDISTALFASKQNREGMSDESLEITKKTSSYLSNHGKNNQIEEIMDLPTEYKVDGLLDNLIHTLDKPGYGHVFFNSELRNYYLDESIIFDLTNNHDSVLYRNGHFGLVVFVSDYNNKGFEKLIENKVWLQVYSRLHEWVSHTSDYYTMLVNEYATVENIVRILAAAQNHPSINSIGLTFVTHGVNSH
jgi:hypothetical protein